MHEYPITEQIIKICSQHCAEAKADKVVSVSLVVGDYSGCVGESIQMYFDIIISSLLSEIKFRLNLTREVLKWRKRKHIILPRLSTIRLTIFTSATAIQP